MTKKVDDHVHVHIEAPWITWNTPLVGYKRLIEEAQGLLEGGDPPGSHPEYERGMAELILRVMGMTADEYDQIYADITEPTRDLFVDDCRMEAAQMWLERHPCFNPTTSNGHCGTCLNCLTWYELAHPEAGRLDIPLQP